MSALLLKKGTYDVLRQVPNDWIDLQEAKELIAQATDTPAGTVRRRLAYLIRCRTIERRPTSIGADIRRVNWDHR
jgi:DNA-binding IclR family transcriptional regulator